MSLRPIELQRSFNDFFVTHREVGGLLQLAEARHFSAKAASTGVCLPVPVKENSLQTQLRPAYGKGPPQPKTIGTHPDFAHLGGTRSSDTSPIVTLFMDMEGSSRLGLFYTNEQVAQIKNAFLCTAIEVVHAFDGHVHRFMGDAVMAFFGGKRRRPEDAAIDAINCASVLWYFVKSVVSPALNKEGYDEEFGFRVGVDYAPNAYWSAYGFPGVEEVTATDRRVDAAAKLQQAAGRNQVMLGQSLLELLDLPEVVTALKQVQRNGEARDEPYLRPNYNLPGGGKSNYRQALLRVDEYLRCTPMAPVAAGLIQDPRFQPLALNMTIHKERWGAQVGDYCAASFVLPKDHWIRFDLSLPFQPMLPFTVEFDVENHGKEAQDDREEDLGNHSTEKHVTRYQPREVIHHWEHLAYRGLHYLTITVRDTSKVVTRRRVGVFIE